MKVDEKKMEFCEVRAEMYVGEDVSPDFYAWIFPTWVAMWPWALALSST